MDNNQNKLKIKIFQNLKIKNKPQNFKIIVKVKIKNHLIKVRIKTIKIYF